MDTLYQDLRYAVRQLRRNPAFAAAAALTLAAASRPRPPCSAFWTRRCCDRCRIPSPAASWRCRASGPTSRAKRSPIPVPGLPGSEHAVRAHGAVPRSPIQRHLAATGPERVQGALVSADFFRVLAVAPSLGRDFRRDEERRGQDQVAVVSDRFWRRHLGADPAAIGRTVRVDGAAHTVIGVLPAGLGFPRETDGGRPIGHEAQWLLESRGLQGYLAVGRLRAGASAEAAQQQIRTIAAALAAEYPHDNEGWTIRLEPLQRALAGDMRPTLYLLFGSWPSSCWSRRSISRTRSWHGPRPAARDRASPRSGPAKSALIGQLLTEDLVLAGLGGALGVVGAVWECGSGRHCGPILGIAGAGDGELARGRVRGVRRRVHRAGLGLAPAIRITRGALADMLRQGGGATARLRRTGRVLIASEIGLALVLGWGLRWSRACSGLRRSTRASILRTCSPRGCRCPRPPTRSPRTSSPSIRGWCEMWRRCPGVEAVGLRGGCGAHDSRGRELRLRHPGPAGRGRPGVAGRVTLRERNADYFRTMAIRLLSGRLSMRATTRACPTSRW